MPTEITLEELSQLDMAIEFEPHTGITEFVFYKMPYHHRIALFPDIIRCSTYHSEDGRMDEFEFLYKNEKQFTDELLEGSSIPLSFLIYAIENFLNHSVYLRLI